MKYDAERIAHCEKMLRLYCHNADGHRFLKNESLISIGQTTDPAYTVAKVLGVKDIRTEVL